MGYIFGFWIISAWFWIIYFVFGSYPPLFGLFIGFGSYPLSFGSFILFLDHIRLPLDHLFCFWIISAWFWIIYFVFGSYPPLFGLFIGFGSYPPAFGLFM